MLAGHCEAIGRDPGEIVTTRLGTLIVAPTAQEAERRRRSWMADRGVDEDSVRMRLIWGDPDEVAETVQAYLDTGLRGLIFNMPAGSTAEDVMLAGTTLAARFG